MNNENIDFKKLENTLITLYGKIELIEELQKHRGDEFNIFSILKMEKLEVNTHSSFLYELINPNGTHYQGDKYLRIFIDKVLEIDDFDFENAKVERETFTNTSRRIDFTIENKDYYIAIEMKIDATDQDNQLSDYFEYAKKQNKSFFKVYYLTLNGRDASDKSFENQKIIDYEKISFQFHILNFIEKCIEKSVSLPIIRESLIQYKNLILKITNQTSKELQMESIKFINSPEMARSATIMSKNLAYIWAKREFLFWKKLEERVFRYIKNKDWKFEISDIFFNEYDENYNDSQEEVINKIINIRNKSSECISFDLIKDDFYFKIYSYSSCNFRYQIFFDSSKDISFISNKINFKYREGKLRYRDSNIKLNFFKDYKEEPTYDIFDDKKLDEIVENIYNEIKSYMDIIVKELD
ncbi:PD-(D/E)XK nuclease family protein [Aliarcobacter butzleri]|uniref:PDDEXK-like family protein n=1 Tax=Aliarcobacter butzleri TaxID=28197 RepID=UPI0021B3D0D4|nr:PD-(D/E)XK nuclease family protein [Aliarcobacter butzleri]MCT7549976.1 PD-(D/E)XK nuclease family protein [Aliarcobacter butzleri]MCT7559476.1 PD-(D/E)XK nuclease family protein [Aliarcobacter butzleri]